MKTSPFYLACALNLSTAAAPAQNVDQRYTVTAVAPAGSSARGMNSLGHIVGATAEMSGFINAGGAYSSHTMDSAYPTYFQAINDGGVVTGSVSMSTGFKAFKYANGTFAPYATLPADDVDSIGTAINNAGNVVGIYTTSAHHGFMERDGAVFTLRPNVQASTALGVNDANFVVGAMWMNGVQRPYLYFNGMAALLDTIGLDDAGFQYGSANAISENGMVAGTFAGTGMPSAGFIFDHGEMRHFHQPGYGLSVNDINSASLLVGALHGNGASPFGRSAYIRGWDSGFHTLDDMLVAGSAWHIVDAAAINDNGQIAATGCYIPTGLCQAVRLDVAAPVPEPAAWSMLLAGLCVGGYAARRRRRVRGRPANSLDRPEHDPVH